MILNRFSLFQQWKKDSVDMRVKAYENIYRKNEEIICLSGEIQDIKFGKHNEQIHAYHCQGEATEKKKLKAALRTIQPCIDHETNPITTNGLIHFDVDVKDNPQLDLSSFKSFLIEQPETVFAFNSINGGLKFGIQTDLRVTLNECGEKLYKYAYDACFKRLCQHFEFEPDTAVRTPKCTMFTSTDPTAYFNGSPAVLPMLKTVEAQFRDSEHKASLSTNADHGYVEKLFRAMPRGASYSDRLIANYMLIANVGEVKAIQIATSHWAKPPKTIVAQIKSQSKNVSFGNISTVEQLVITYGGTLPKKTFPRAFEKLAFAQRSNHKFEDLLSIGEAQEQLTARISDVFEDGKTICIRSSAGVGKTEIALGEIAKQAKTKKILYLTPTHKLGREVAERYCEIAKEKGTLNLLTAPNQIYGKSNTDHKNNPLCEVSDTREKYAQAKLSIPSFECEQCMYAEECRYTEQFNHPSNFRIQTNAHLFIEPSKYENGFRFPGGVLTLRSGNWTPDIIVIDEDFIKTEDFNLMKKTKHPVLSRILTLLEAHCSAMEQDNRNVLQHLGDILEAHRTQIIDAYQMSKNVNTRSTEDYIASQKAFSHDEKRALECFNQYLTCSDNDIRGIWLRHDNDVLWLNGTVLKEVQPRFKKIPTLILDATAQAAVLQQIMPTVRVANLNVKPNPQVRLFQCQNASFSKTFLDKEQNIEDLVTQLNSLIAQHQPDAVGLLTYKNITSQPDFDKHLASRLEHDGNIVFRHFGDIRGTNEFDDVNLFFVIGRQDIGNQKVVAKGEVIFGQTLTHERSNYPNPARMIDGTARSLNNTVFSDERLAATYDHFCRAETLQAVARARPIQGNPKICYLFTNEILGADVSITGFFNFNYSEQPKAIKELERVGFVRTTPKEMKKLGFTENQVNKQNRHRILDQLNGLGYSLNMISFKNQYYKVQKHEYLVKDWALFEQFCKAKNYTII